MPRVHAVQGRKGEALDRLEEALSAGWISDPPIFMSDLAADPPLALLKGELRFGAARRKMLDFIAKERAELGPVRLGGEKRRAA